MVEQRIRNAKVGSSTLLTGTTEILFLESRLASRLSHFWTDRVTGSLDRLLVEQSVRTAAQNRTPGDATEMRMTQLSQRPATALRRQEHRDEDEGRQARRGGPTDGTQCEADSDPRRHRAVALLVLLVLSLGLALGLAPLHAEAGSEPAASQAADDEPTAAPQPQPVPSQSRLRRSGRSAGPRTTTPGSPAAEWPTAHS